MHRRADELPDRRATSISDDVDEPPLSRNATGRAARQWPAGGRALVVMIPLCAALIRRSAQGHEPGDDDQHSKRGERDCNGEAQPDVRDVHAVRLPRRS